MKLDRADWDEANDQRIRLPVLSGDDLFRHDIGFKEFDGLLVEMLRYFGISLQVVRKVQIEQNVIDSRIRSHGNM